MAGATAALALPPALDPPRRAVIRHAPALQPAADEHPAARHLLLVPGPDRPLPLTPPRRGLAREVGVFDPQPTSRRHLPGARWFGSRLVRAVLEVRDGHRPIGQVRRWLSPVVYGELRRAASSVGGQAGGTVLRSLRVCEPADGVAEVCGVVVGRGGHAEAVAARLEGVDGRWRCVVLRFVGAVSVTGGGSP